MSEWTTVTWGDVVTLQRGVDITKAEQNLAGSVPVVSSGGASSYHDVALQSGPGVIMGRKGTLGRVYYVDGPYWPHDTTLWVKDFKGNDPRFVYYALSNLDIGHLNVGTASPTLNRNHVHPIPVMWPPDLADQRAIAATLGALDDKIDSNRRVIDRLEALGAALLESVLEPDVFGFPQYEPSVVLGDLLATLETGSRPRGGVVVSDAGVVSLGAESIQSAGVVATVEFKRVPDTFAASMRRGHLEDGDVLVYKDGGKPGNFIPHVSAFGQGFPTPAATINEHVYRVRASRGISQGLLYWILRSPWMDQEMRKRGTGVAIPGLNSTNFRELPWPVISPSASEQLNQRLDPMITGMLTLGAQNIRLAALREVLLPQLLSGRIQATDANAANHSYEPGQA